MNMKWKNVDFAKKIIFGFAVLLVAATAGLSYTSIKIEEVDGLADYTFEMYNNVNSLLSAESAHYLWVNNVANYLIHNTADPLNVVKDGTQCAFGKWYYGKERLDLETEIPALKELFATLEAPHLALHNSAIDIEKAEQNNNFENALTIYNSITLKNLDIIRSGLVQAREIVTKNIASTKQDLMTAFKNTKNASLIINAFIFLFGVLLSITLIRAVVAPLKYLVKYAQEVAKGALIQPKLDQNDEIGQLAKALGLMVSTLQGCIVDSEQKTQNSMKKEEEAVGLRLQAEKAIKETQESHSAILHAVENLEKVISTINTESREMVTRIEESENSANVIASQISESATAMNEMSSTATEVAQNATAASKISTEARKMAEHGLQTVDNMMQSIHNVHVKSLTLKENMSTLSSHAQAINNIMSVISDIADQTNLLALNAAIEAARAGEAGRGFAVVADEVRKLAEKTMYSTSDVSKAIILIQQSVENSINQVEDTVQTIASTTELSKQSGASLQEIVGMVDKTVSQVHNIAVASEEQSATSEEINRSLSQINRNASLSANAMLQAKNSTTNLAQQAKILMDLTNEMKK